VMRMDARMRGFQQGMLRSKRVLGLLLLALPVGLSQIDIAGRSVGSYIAELVFPPASARRAPRSFGADLRQPQAPVRLPAFVPWAPALAPPAPPPVFRQPATGPAFGAVTPSDVRKPPEFFAVSKPLRQESRGAKAERGPDDAPHRTARAPL